MSKWEYLVLENYQNNVVDEKTGEALLDEDGAPVYEDVWTCDMGDDHVAEIEGTLAFVLNDLGAEGWEAVTTTGDEFVNVVVLKREL